MASGRNQSLDLMGLFLQAVMWEKQYTKRALIIIPFG
jgi:hypothetical protein